MSGSLWKRCTEHLQSQLNSRDFNTWVRPLQAVEKSGTLYLYTPNNFVRDWVDEHLTGKISNMLSRFDDHNCSIVVVEVGSYVDAKPPTESPPTGSQTSVSQSAPPYACGLRENFVFDNFVAGKSNQIARAAAIQVAQNPKNNHNSPLFIYGGVGLGKTHLMHAIGNQVRNLNPSTRIAYLHAERFVADMVAALQNNQINTFKKFYRSIEVLLIDDIQFFAGKQQSQEEFFPHLQCVVRTTTSVGTDLRSLSKRNPWLRGAAEIALWFRVAS